MASDNINEALAYLEALQRRQEAKVYENSLIDFIEYAWPVVEPATPFRRGWAIEAICEHLEAVTKGEITRLVINVSPGFTKSLITDVFWPAWEWGPRNMPHLRYVCASYAQHLTIRDNVRFGNIVKNRRFKEFWGTRFGIRYDTKVKIENDHMGWKFATSVGGVTGGERGDRFIIDDPNNPTETESDTVRGGVNQWFVEVVPDRLNDMTKSAIVIIQQRVHEEDVSGTALSKDLGYTHLMIPMEYDSSRYPEGYSGTTIGWMDPRAEDGELAWPERFPIEAVRVLRQKGPYAYSGNYQQSPEPRGGGIFKRDWWRKWDPKPTAKGERMFPSFSFVLASLDPAYTEKEENDPSALTIWGVFHDKEGMPGVMLVDAWRKRLELHGPNIPKLPGETEFSYRLRSQEHWGLIEWVADSCARKKVDRLLIENKASGISVSQEIRRLYGASAWGVELVEPKGDKVARAYSVQHLFSEGLVFAPWKDGYWQDFSMIVIDECASFPKAAHDDLVDTTSQAMRYMRDNNLIARRAELEETREELVRYKRPKTALYPT